MVLLLNLLWRIRGTKVVYCRIKKMSDEEDLSVKLEGLLGEITKVMESRKERIIELRAEIDRIENENAALENTISTILSSFDS
mgnify:CR=1 FL=1